MKEETVAGAVTRRGCRVRVVKAAEDCRSPRPGGNPDELLGRASVLECGGGGNRMSRPAVSLSRLWPQGRIAECP
ncbi:MAG: hypothetical protein JWQ04_1649 [Pedosphaera sp.]|nr:hypothetical protein [Pedosphaera sp.]